MEKLEELYSLIPEGMYSSMEQFQLDLEQEGLESIFELIPEGMYADIEQFTDDFVELKKKDDSQFSSQEEVMESDTEVVEEPGTSVPLSPETPEQPQVVTEEVVEEDQTQIETPPDQVEDTASYINLEGSTDLTEEELQNLTPGEKNTALERTFGKNEFTDFFGDMYRAGSQGQGQAGLVDDSLEIFGKGKSASDSDIEDFIAAHNVMTSSGPSDEMKDFDKVFEQSGGGIYGFLKGLLESPSVAPQLFVSSISAMLNPASLAAAGATTGGFALSGSGAGPLGAVAGGIASIPFAMGAAGATLETGLSFAEFLNEELEEKGLKFTKEDIRKVLNDPEAMSRIRAKSAGRGAIIGIVDRYAAGLGGKLVGGMAKTGAKKGARILAAAGVEAVGGSTGEAAARAVVGQDMDIKEIGFEGIAGTSTTPITYLYGTQLAKPVYKINNKGTMGVVDRKTMVEMINTPDDKAFAAMDIEIVNDPELKAIAKARKTKLVQESAIINQLKEAGITDETAIAELTALEREKQALQGNTTRAGKKKLSEIDAKIDAIMDQEVTEEVEVTEDELVTQDSDAVKRETYETINDDGNKVTVEVTTAKDGSRILRYKDAEGNTFQTETLAKDNDIANEKIIELNVAEEGADITNIETIEGFENIANKKVVAKRKQELKTKQDAIQESSTESVDVQEQTEDGRAVGDGDTQATITEESIQEEQTDVDAPTQEEIDTESRDLESFLNDNDVVTEETEVTTNEIVDETPGQIVNDNFTVTEKTTTENDSYYNSDVFTQENPNTTVDQHENKIINLATKAVKAITKILPDTKVVVHRSQEAYNKYADVKNTRGTFDPGTNTIHINMPLANNKTIAHEVFHAVLYTKYGTDIKIAEVTDRMVKAVKRKVKDKKLIKQLDDFAAKYDNFQNEEYLSELVGILADNYPSLAAPEKSIVRKWFEKVAKMLKIEVAIDTDADVLDLLNTISKKVKEGTEIATEEVTQLDAFEGGQVVENPASALQKNQVGDFEVTYTQQESVADMINAGLITEPKDISFIEDSEVTITAPDDMLAGEIKYKGKVIFEGEGGVFFVTKFGDVWASGKKGTANTIANSLNKQLKNNNGKAYLVLTKGTDAKLVSSASGVTSTLAILNTMLDNNLIAPSIFRSAVSSAVKKAGGIIDLRQSAKDLKTDIANYFTDPTTTTFEKRGFVVKDIVGEIAKTLDKPSQQAIAKFLGGDIKRSVTKGETKFGSQSLVDLIARIAAEKLTKGLNVGDVYAVIEVNNEVEVKEDSHPSYPFHISLKDGGKPILHLLKNRQPGGEVLIQKSGKPYAVRNVSVVEGKVKKADSKVTEKKKTTKQRQQKVVFNIEKQRVYKDDASGVTFLTKGYGGRFINISRKAVTIKDIDGLSQYQKPLVEVTMERDVYNKQPDARTVIDGKEKFVNQLDTIRGFKKIRLIEDTPAVKNTLQRIRSLAQQSGINKKNFLPGTLSNPQALNRILKELGYSLKTYGPPTKPYGYGIIKPDGKLFRMSQQRQQVADVLTTDMDAVEIITIARANNFRGPAIKDYLVRVKKMKVKDVVDLLKVPVDIFSNIPEAFTNIKEGMNEGVRLYTDIIEKSKKWQIKNKATDAATFDKAVQFLEESKLFKNQADPKRKALSTLQKEMIVGMQKSLGVRPMKNTNLKLRALRQSLKDTKRGAKELKAVQSKLRNFIRRSLPAKLYTKGEITTLISDVTNATEANIDNLIQKVIDKITTIQVADLETTIDKLLNDQYEKVESGREKGKKISVDVNDRLKALKKDMVTDSMVADDVVKRNLELNQEFNEITNKSEQLSEGDLSRLIDIKILINLNNATLMESTDVNKVQSLNEAVQLLTEVVGRGKELFKAQLKKDHKRYMDNKETVYEAVTGDKVDMSDPEQVAKAKKTQGKRTRRKARRETDSLFKKAMRSIDLALNSFVKASESLSGLMNIIDKLPGDLIGGKVRKMVYNKFNESLRVYKARMKGNRQNIETKLQEVFGKKWKSAVTNMRKPINTGIYISPAEVKKAQEKYDADPSRKNKKNLNKVITDNEIIMSQSEILYQWQQYQDPANLPSFANPDNPFFGEDHKRIMDGLMEKVDPKTKEIGDWLVEEFYPSLYDHYNKTYKAIYRTNLPWNDKYAGRIYREANVPNPLDLLGTDIKSNNQVSAASTKVRRANTKPITKMDMMDVMLTYTTDMEWFASHAEAVRDVNKMFDDPLIAQAIEDNNGEGTLLLIRSSIEKIARRGINNAARGKFINAINNMFISARLGANPTIFLKQMTSFITFANDIGFVNYIKYAAKNKTEAIKVYKEIWNNSVYVQDRASERIQSVIESYTAMGNLEFNPSDNFIIKLMMAPVKYGDLGAIFLGGSPNYSYYKAEFQKKNPTATEQQAIDHAIRKFEDDTKNTQQSADLQDKDFYQTSDPIIRSFNMFLTTPKQYLRKEFGAMRNLYRKLKAFDKNAGQGTLGENIRQLAMYHTVMPMFFQFVALGFPDLSDLEDEEKEDLLRAAIIGNFNALFIAGDVIAMLADAAQDKPWAGTTKSLAPLNVMTEITTLYTRAEKTKDPKKKAELTQKLILRVTELSLTPTKLPLPLVNIAKYAKNIDKLGEGGTEKDFLRLFNYSDYVINKDDRKKGTKLSKEEMKLYFPDLYEQEMALDKEMKELDKSLELEF